MFLLAHAEEFHTETTPNLVHYLTEPWVLVALIGLAVLLCWRYAGAWRMSAILGVLFIGGLVGYRWSPWVGVFCISGGFSLALLMMLSGGGKAPAEEEPGQPKP